MFKNSHTNSVAVFNFSLRCKLSLLNCVLSHTNVPSSEVETFCGGTF